MKLDLLVKMSMSIPDEGTNWNLNTVLLVMPYIIWLYVRFSSAYIQWENKRKMIDCENCYLMKIKETKNRDLFKNQ